MTLTQTFKIRRTLKIFNVLELLYFVHICVSGYIQKKGLSFTSKDVMHRSFEHTLLLPDGANINQVYLGKICTSKGVSGNILFFNLYHSTAQARHKCSIWVMVNVPRENKTYSILWHMFIEL